MRRSRSRFLFKRNTVYASRYGHKEIVKSLLENGININQSDEKNVTKCITLRILL